jgi:1,2-diacylglycerol 3-alpha-glucosyltransferase
MNIAFFTESYKPYISGVTVSIETLAKELRKLGHKVYIFAPRYKGHREQDSDVFRFPSLPSAYPGFRLAIPFSKKISGVIPKLNLDLIHSHSPFQLGMLGKRLAKKLGIPYVYTLHTLFDQYAHYVPFLPKALSKKIISAHLKKFCNGCDAVIVPSKPVRALARKEGVRSRMMIVPTGVDLEIAKSFSGANVRSRHGISRSETVLLYVGRLTREKNIPFLFRAFKLILEEEKNVRLMLVAGGPIEKELKAMAKKLGISSRVKFVGIVKYPYVFNYYAAADIFVFASTTETQGLVVAEAFASGLPVVVVDAAGVSDAITNGETGYLCPHDEKIFAKKVLSLIWNEAKRKEMSAKALAHVKKHFSAEAYAGVVERIYKGLL